MTERRKFLGRISDWAKGEIWGPLPFKEEKAAQRKKRVKVNYRIGRHAALRTWSRLRADF